MSDNCTTMDLFRLHYSHEPNHTVSLWQREERDMSDNCTTVDLFRLHYRHEPNHTVSLWQREERDIYER